MACLQNILVNESQHVYMAETQFLHVDRIYMVNFHECQFIGSIWNLHGDVYINEQSPHVKGYL